MFGKCLRTQTMAPTPNKRTTIQSGGPSTFFQNVAQGLAKRVNYGGPLPDSEAEEYGTCLVYGPNSDCGSSLVRKTQDL
jgi:hypothetical protein